MIKNAIQPSESQQNVMPYSEFEKPYLWKNSYVGINLTSKPLSKEKSKNGATTSMIQ
jgi:hypothetical protein